MKKNKNMSDIVKTISIEKLSQYYFNEIDSLNR